LVSDLGHMPRANSSTASQSEGMRAKPPDKMKSMAQKVSSPVIFQGGKCSKSYSKKWRVNRHLKSHEKPFTCNASGCDAAFALGKDRRRHMKQVHLGFASEGDKLKCISPACTFSSTRRHSLKRHLQGVHAVRIIFEASNSSNAP